MNQQSSRQFLTFSLADEDYALDILRVREIRGWSKPRHLPDLPPFMTGVMDFRGGVAPVLDLRLRFRAEQAANDRETVIILVALHHQEQQHIIGLVVDRVADVIDVSPAEIRQQPALGKSIDPRYMQGVVQRDERLVVLLDIDRLLDDQTIEWMDKSP